MKKIIATLALLALVTGGILVIVRQNTADRTQAQTTVAASYYPLYDFAKNIGGEKTRVTNLTPPGIEPHDYEPSAKKLVEAQAADVFLYNGYFEHWADAFLRDYKHVSVKASQGMRLQAIADEEHSEKKVPDPHFWLDLVLAQSVADNIRQGLSKADPANKAIYEHNAEVYKAKLATLHADFQRGLASCKSRTIVTSHAAFGYLAKRYDLRIVPLAGLSPEAEPSPAQLAELSRFVKSQNIRYIFFESLASPRLAQAIADETGAKTLVFDPIEGLSEKDQKQGKNYLNVQRQNLKSLRLALDCQ